MMQLIENYEDYITIYKWLNLLFIKSKLIVNYETIKKKNDKIYIIII